MIYAICQTPKCQHPYPVTKLDTNAKSVPCQKCGGVLVDENGSATLSHKSAMKQRKFEEKERKQKELLIKKKKYNILRQEIETLEEEIS